MIDALFLQILSMSFTAGIIVIFVLIARILLKKMPKIFSYLLWGVVLFRLVCPFSFESFISLLPANVNPISPKIYYQSAPKIDSPIVNNGVKEVLPQATSVSGANNMQVWIFVASMLWVVGIVYLIIYSVILLMRLKNSLRDAVHKVDNIFNSETLTSPFVMGIFHPKIYIPANLAIGEKKYIILHEQMHIKRFDHVIKLLSFIVLSIHWFNPLVWVAFFLSGKDMEMSCDEGVIRQLGNDVKREYSASLLSLATGKRMVRGTPLAFGEGDTKSRIKNVLNYKKPSLWVIAVIIVAIITIGIGLISNPIKSKYYGSSTGTGNSYRLEFKELNIEKTHKLTLKEGNILDVEIEMKHGQIDILIMAQNKNVAFRGDKRTESTSFSVTIPTDGVYTISVKGSEARGIVNVAVQGAVLANTNYGTTAKEISEKYAFALLAGDIAGIRMLTPQLNPPAKEVLEQWRGAKISSANWINEDIRETKAEFVLAVTVEKAPSGFILPVGTTSYYVYVEKCNAGWYVVSGGTERRSEEDLKKWWDTPNLIDGDKSLV